MLIINTYNKKKNNKKKINLVPFIIIQKKMEIYFDISE